MYVIIYSQASINKNKSHIESAVHFTSLRPNAIASNLHPFTKKCNSLKSQGIVTWSQISFNTERAVFFRAYTILFCLQVGVCFAALS